MGDSNEKVNRIRYWVPRREIVQETSRRVMKVMKCYMRGKTEHGGGVKRRNGRVPKDKSLLRM